jgi:hypothetical protein
MNESDTEYEGGRTVNLANSRSDRNLINLPHEYKPKEKNMSYNTYDQLKNNELEYKTYNHVLPRSHSMNKLETNYNYGSSRNQLEAHSSKSFSTRKYEINNNDTQTYRPKFTNNIHNKIYSKFKNNSVNEKVVSDDIKENSYRREENNKSIRNYSRNYSKELNRNEERNNHKYDRVNLETYSSHRENSIENRNNSAKIDRADYLYKTSLASTNCYKNNIPKPELKMYDTAKYNPNNDYKFIKRDELVRRRNLDTTYETKNEHLTKYKVSLVLRIVKDRKIKLTI